MQKIFVLLTGLAGLGLYLLFEGPLGTYGALAAAIVGAVGAMWLVTLIPSGGRDDARKVAIGLTVLGWLYLIAIILKKGGAQAAAVGAWAVVIESVLLTGPVWFVVWWVRRMAAQRAALPRTVPVVGQPAAIPQQLGFGDGLKVSALAGVLEGHAANAINPQLTPLDRATDYRKAVERAAMLLRKRPELASALLAEVRTDLAADPARREMCDRIITDALGATPAR
jgi:hypothetical protein